MKWDKNDFVYVLERRERERKKWDNGFELPSTFYDLCWVGKLSTYFLLLSSAIPVKG